MSKNTKNQLSNSLGSTLKAGATEMKQSFGTFLGNNKNSTQDRLHLKPNQITPEDVTYEEKTMKKREVKILV